MLLHHPDAVMLVKKVKSISHSPSSATSLPWPAQNRRIAVGLRAHFVAKTTAGSGCGSPGLAMRNKGPAFM